jgi:TonB family C-terminal domain
MRLWLQSYAPATTATPSVFVSVAAHAVLIGAAVYGTGVRSRELAEDITQRVYYLPPPDRVPASEATVERVQYVDVGNGARVAGLENPTGAPPGAPRPDERKGGRGADGVDPVDRPSTVPVPSDDSVYSILNVEETAVRTEGSAAPAYPPALIQQGIEGSVLANFVIDTTGRADSTSIEILQATHPLFVQSVRTAIPGMRFSPAMVQGRKVRQMVEQRFQFRITPPAVAAPAEHTRTNPVP